MLKIDRVSHGFQDGSSFRWLFQDLSFDFHSSKSVVVWGPSGSGKTTLLNILAGLLRPSNGEVVLAREPPLHIHSASDKELLLYRRHQVGFIYQFFNLLPTLTVLENVELPLELTNQMDKKDAAREILCDLGLESRITAFPAKLSGGEQQRVAIARALIHRPSIVLADEPTGNLDQANSEKVVETLFAKTREIGAALIVASHNLLVKEKAQHQLSL